MYQRGWHDRALQVKADWEARSYEKREREQRRVMGDGRAYEMGMREDGRAKQDQRTYEQQVGVFTRVSARVSTVVRLSVEANCKV